MRWLELNLVPYKTSRGAKSALKGSSRPLLAPLSPPKPPRTSPKPPQIPSVNLHNPPSYLITHWFSQNHLKMQNKNWKCKNSPKLQKTAKLKKCKNENWPVVISHYVFRPKNILNPPKKMMKVAQKGRNSQKRPQNTKMQISQNSLVARFSNFLWWLVR